MTTVASTVYSNRYRHLIRMFPLRPLRTRAEAEVATQILDRLFRDRYEDEGEAAYVYVLAGLLEDYERRHDPTADTASALDILGSLMEEHGMKQADLAELLGVGQSAVSMILGGHRPITADHARRLGKKFKIDPGAFL